MTGVRVNLNADLGEGCGDDDAMLDLVGAANIACGFHAGDFALMGRTVRAALARGVGLGAHPSYPDRDGFGRRPMAMPPDELVALIAYQVGALAAVAGAQGGRLGHVKPHGALSNLAAVDRPTADAIARAVLAVDRRLILLAPAGSCMVEAGRAAGLAVAEEVFADRAYDDDGNLVPRTLAGAVIHDPDAAARHVLAMVQGGAIVSMSGKRIACRVQSVCVHGDTPDAVTLARRVKAALEAAGIGLCTLS